ncbi:hypothetical protein ABIS04_04265 [Shewanella sp. H8]
MSNARLINSNAGGYWRDGIGLLNIRQVRDVGSRDLDCHRQAVGLLN